ncbi:hypothetical protein [Rufibacter latericius]|uniref:Uncharacterized protein n=1 Tax=Rufibacter latericius TaxID=2487040 RepID=A0A3M9MEZ4_9BACT|nr:hypothetical protein [Rufibacter latericius]RNI23413.1 hypothetical protein EFB08_17875 [Rufibacter latericius]
MREYFSGNYLKAGFRKEQVKLVDEFICAETSLIVPSSGDELAERFWPYFVENRPKTFGLP